MWRSSSYIQYGVFQHVLRDAFQIKNPVKSGIFLVGGGLKIGDSRLKTQKFILSDLRDSTGGQLRRTALEESAQGQHRGTVQ